MSSNSLLGRKALLNGNIQLAEHHFSKVESSEIEFTQEILHNRALFAIYFRKFSLALELINQLEPSLDQSKLLALYHYFNSNISASMEFAASANDTELLSYLQQFK
eukprot:NODE_511_length_7387_cov_0.329857.p4 type:complete len:106 gc:universal NODE_511_length_7387_cov_0.329857:2971-3288(+)